MVHNKLRPVIFILLLSLLLSACGEEQAFIAASSSPTPTSALPEPTPTLVSPTATSTPVVTPTEISDIGLWMSPALPLDFVEQITLPMEILVANEENSADYVLKIGKESPLSYWVYALAAPFPTIIDDLSASDLIGLWKGDIVENSAFRFDSLIMDENTISVFSEFWGVPAKTVKTLSADQLLETAWAEGSALAILPFTELQAKWKVLSVDGISPMRKDFNLEAYALSVPISLIDKDLGSEGVLLDASSWLPAANRDPNKLTTVALTGVTALVRATAAFMEIFGITAPAEKIGPILQDADILHISNEIPFAKDCPYPDPSPESDLIFCSRDKYIELLEFIGADVIELTGDHFQDWGEEAMLHTLDLYDQRGWPTYGGGETLEDARQPVLLEHNGNRIAFLGCNGKERGYALAGETTPGAYHCDMEWMESEVRRLVSEGYQVIVTFQHLEYYDSTIYSLLQRDFNQMAEAGAVVVSGSQAHQPHGFEFNENAFIHYGLGNLFFDQYNWCIACRSAFIDQHIFYDGHYLGVELITTQFENNARSRLTTPEEREALLDLIFSASEW